MAPIRSVLGYDGQGLHHTVYVNAIAHQERNPSGESNGTQWTPAALASAAGVITTGNIHEPAT